MWSSVQLYKCSLDMIPTGSAKYFSYSSSVYLVMSTDCITACKQTLNDVNSRYLLGSSKKNAEQAGR